MEAAVRTGDRQTARRIVARFRQPARLHLETELFPEWGDLLLQGRPREAADTLQLARGIAEALFRANGDRMGVETVAAIDRAATSPSLLKRLAAAHRDLGRDPDARQLPALRKSFQDAGSPFEGWAAYHLARCHYQDNSYDETLRTLAPLLSPEAELQFPSLAAKSLRLVGLTHFIQGELTDSLTAFQRAESLLLRIGEAEGLAGVRSLISESLRALGETERAGIHLALALAQSSQVLSSREAQIILEEAVESALAQGEPALALLFEDEVLERWVDAGDALARSAALQRRAQIHLRLGNKERAAGDLRAALDAAAKIENDADRESQIGDLQVALGQSQAGDKWPLAVASFTEAIRLYRETSYNQPLPDLYIKRSMAYVAQGLEELAEDDLRSAAVEVERQRGTLSDTALRTSFLDSSRALFDRWVQIAVERGDPVRAFDHAERGRARTLLDAIAGRRAPDSLPVAAEALPLAEIQAQIPSGTALVIYRVLADRWMAWVVHANGFHFEETLTPEPVIEEQVRRFREDAQSRRADRFATTSRYLYRELLQPLEKSIGDATTLIVIPDGALHRLPFGALLNPATGRYLVEGHAIAKAPSASVYVATLQKSALKPSGSLTALSVGDPAFDPERYTLFRLEAARKQAEHAAAAFPGSTLLTGDAATKEVFLAEAGDHPLVFFAGHAIPNFKAPWKAGLLFAPSRRGGDDGVLTVEEIERASFQNTGLVILGGCSTADGHVAASEGVMNLARPFLVAGIPAVVGTLWDVEDQEAGPLLIDLQERLRSGRSPLVALRETQVEFLKREDSSPRAWAAFELIGGVSTPLSQGAQ